MFKPAGGVLGSRYEPFALRMILAQISYGFTDPVRDLELGLGRVRNVGS